MTTGRPTVAPGVIAAMIESTPDRVRRRLDRTPDVAEGWDWRQGETAWSVAAGDETVSLPLGRIIAADQIACTCLLSPRCFHVLACLTRLEVASDEAGPTEEAEPVSPDAEPGAEGLAETSPSQRRAATEAMRSVAQLLRVGVANAGVVLQSGLLRAIHQCRAEGLHRLAGLGLRAAGGIGEVRSRSSAADPETLAGDLADLLETGHRVLCEGPVADYWIGTARRKQEPVSPRRLLGLFAEPVVTRGGYAGAAVHFLGGDGRIYTASDVRPGEAQHARDVYFGGIEIGPLVRSAKQLARGAYLGTELTASADGRLGRGKGVQMVEQGPSSWHSGPIEERFRRPLSAQWDAAQAQAARPADAREGGWDLLFLEGTVLGAAGAVLLFQPADDHRTVGLAVANESDSLCFRENLRMLSHAPGLRLKVIGRADPAEPRTVSALAIASIGDGDGKEGDAAPRLEIPESLGGRICLGFEEVRRHFLINARHSAMVLPVQHGPREDPLESLRRRWVATMLAGVSSPRLASSSILAAEVAALRRGGYTAGAALLDALSREPSTDGPTGIDTFLATAVYVRACAIERARSELAMES